MEIVNEQYADKVYDKSTYIHKHFCYQISNKIWIIVSLAFIWLSIWNFIYVSQLTLQMQLHTMKLQQLKHDMSILFKMHQNMNKQFGIPITADLSDSQHSLVLDNYNNDNNIDIYGHDDSDHNDNNYDINDILFAKTFKDLENQEMEMITEKLTFDKKQGGTNQADEGEGGNTVKILSNKINNEAMKGPAEEHNHKLHLDAVESFAFESYQVPENNYGIKEQLKRSKRSHTDIVHGLESELEHRNANKQIETTMKRATSVSSTLNNNKPAAHFHINRSIPDSYSDIRIHPYRGDLYIGHPSWTNDMNIAQDFHIENGILRVHQPGLYYVYAQICYNNSHDQNGFIIFHGHKPFLQCLNTIPTNLSSKLHTCHTSGLIYLKTDEKLHLRDFHRDRNAILKDTNYRSYFGLIKI